MRGAGCCQTGEAGFTLIELLIAMVIGGLLLGVTAAALVFGVGTSARTSQTIEFSASIQRASTWFLSDAQSVEAAHDAPSCSEEPTGASELLISLTWGLSEDDTTGVSVDWWQAFDPDTEREIIARLVCDANGGTIFGPHPVLVDVDPDAVSINCSPSSCDAAWTLSEQGDARTIALNVARRVTS